MAVFILGTPIGVVMLYQSLSVVLSQFNHANINLPTRLDQWLSYVLVTPHMHKVHHHHVLPYTDSNFGNIFAIWDRLFGTYKNLDAARIIYGVDGFQNEFFSPSRVVEGGRWKRSAAWLGPAEGGGGFALRLGTVLIRSYSVLEII